MNGLEINQAGILLQDGKPVKQILSPYGRGDLIPSELKYLVMHYTAGSSGESSARLFQRNRAQVSAHFVLERSGEIIQCRPTTKVANHAGKSRYEDEVFLNDNSIGVEYANRGFTMVPRPDYVHMSHRLEPGLKRYWEPYPEAQIVAGIALNNAILDRHSSITAIIGHDECSLSGKTDPGPLFPMQRVEDASGLSSSWFVKSNSGLNLRTQPNQDGRVLRLMNNRDKVQIISRNGLWVEVFHESSKSTGWCHSAFLVKG